MILGNIMNRERLEIIERIHEIQRRMRELEREWIYVEPEVFPHCYCGKRIPIRKRGEVYNCTCGARFCLDGYVFDGDTGKYYMVFTDLNKYQELQGEYGRLQGELEGLLERYNELVREQERHEREKAQEYLDQLARRGYRVDEVGDDYVVINGRRIGVVFDGEAYYPDTEDEELAEIIRELMLLHERGYV